MNILLTGDLHFNQTHYKWLEKEKDSYDCLCMTGDFLDGHSGKFEQETEWVSRWMKELDKQIFICSGNHDLDELAECDWLNAIKSPKICSDNGIKIVHGIKFGCMPYLGADLSRFQDCDVLLTHVSPFKTATSRSMVSGIQKDWGDAELYYALRDGIIRPRYIFCGHVEKPIAKRSRLFNAEIINPGAQHNSSVPGHENIFIEGRLPDSLEQK